MVKSATRTSLALAIGAPSGGLVRLSGETVNQIFGNDPKGAFVFCDSLLLG